jgi:N6-adenosine-specific RNA methylase IME4
MNSILYQNASRTVTLLDLPHSISRASGVHVVASTGPAQPFPSTEPKGSKREKMLSSIPRDEQVYHEQLAELIANAMLEVRQYLGQKKWCLDRAEAVSPHGNRSTKWHSDAPEKENNGAAYLLKRYWNNGSANQHRPQPDAAEGALEPEGPESPTPITPPLVLSPLGSQHSSLGALQNTVIFNPSTSIVRIHIPKRSFIVPPRCAFLSSSIQQGSHIFETSSKALGRPSAIHPGLFNFILLDPPWPNRSVRNAKVYNTSEGELEEHPFYQTLPIIGRYLSPAGITAVWITNKRAIRQAVLRSLREMGLGLYEEWIWLKVTSYGEPVTTLDGLWRKPYEVLLLFRRQVAVYGGQSYLPEYPEVKRRVVIAVPDIHSRKPCLKELLKPPLVPEEYTALEIFARNLTAGWWSWGNEVLKFNEEGAA